MWPTEPESGLPPEGRGESLGGIALSVAHAATMLLPRLVAGVEAAGQLPRLQRLGEPRPAGGGVGGAEDVVAVLGAEPRRGAVGFGRPRAVVLRPRLDVGPRVGIVRQPGDHADPFDADGDGGK